MARRRRDRAPRVAHEELELEVERLVNGAGSLAHEPGGRVVFLDEGLPGERVRAQVESEHKGFLRARVVRALDPPSPLRRTPPCPVVALCGGCPWQALEYEAQVEAKQEIVLAEVTRACGTAPDEMRPPVVGPQWRSRHRIRLGVKRAGDGGALVGYRGRGAHDVVPLDDCAIARAELSAALPLARTLAVSLKSVREIEISIDDDGQLFLRAQCSSGRSPDVASLHEALRGEADELDLASARYAGVILEASDKDGGWRTVAGDDIQKIRVSPSIDLAVPVGAFTQVNADLNPELVSAVVEAADSGPGRRIVDLYCGAGNFSLPLAQAGAVVLGIDTDERAIAAAGSSALAHGLTDRLRFVAQKADPAAFEDFQDPDVVVLDPPRAGAAPALAGVLERRPSTIVYVSCDVATFGRDARRIIEAGWSFASLQLIDLTPQTYRAEVLGVFRLTWERSGTYREG